MSGKSNQCILKRIIPTTKTTTNIDTSTTTTTTINCLFFNKSLLLTPHPTTTTIWETVAKSCQLKQHLQNCSLRIAVPYSDPFSGMPTVYPNILGNVFKHKAGQICCSRFSKMNYFHKLEIFVKDIKYLSTGKQQLPPPGPSHRRISARRRYTRSP